MPSAHRPQFHVSCLNLNSKYSSIDTHCTQGAGAGQEMSSVGGMGRGEHCWAERSLEYEDRINVSFKVIRWRQLGDFWGTGVIYQDVAGNIVSGGMSSEGKRREISYGGGEELELGRLDIRTGWIGGNVLCSKSGMIDKYISIHVRHRDSRDRGGSIWELYRHILGILDDLGWRRRVEGGYEVVRGGLGVEVRVGEEWRGDGGRGCLRYGGGDSSGGRAQVGDGVHDNVWWVEVYDTVVVEYMDRGWVGGVESKGEDVRVTMSISDDLGRRGIVQLYDVDRCWGWKMIWRLRGCGFNELPTAERGVSKVVIVQAEGSPSLGAPTPSPVSPHPLHTSSSSDELIIRMVSFTMVRHQQIEADPSLSLYPPQRLIEKLHWNFYGSKRI
ncbi:hypothetical protein Tco_1354908 [Tanacetum coccineum]